MRHLTPSFIVIAGGLLGCGRPVTLASARKPAPAWVEETPALTNNVEVAPEVSNGTKKTTETEVEPTPGLKAEPKPQTVVITRTSNPPAVYILFDRGQSVANQRATAVLDVVAKVLIEHPSVKIALEGHADPSGPAALAQHLGQKRAEDASKQLRTCGIDPSRFEVHSASANCPTAKKGSPVNDR